MPRNSSLICICSRLGHSTKSQEVEHLFWNFNRSHLQINEQHISDLEVEASFMFLLSIVTQMCVLRTITWPPTSSFQHILHHCPRSPHKALLRLWHSLALKPWVLPAHLHNLDCSTGCKTFCSKPALPAFSLSLSMYLFYISERVLSTTDVEQMLA